MLRDAFASFRHTATADFGVLGLDGPLDFTLTADMRFVGQAFEIPVDIDGADLPDLTAAGIADRFGAAHRRVYVHGGEPGRQAEVVALHFGVRRRLDALPDIPERATPAHSPGTVPVHAGGAGTGATRLDARLVTASALGSEAVAGPALIEGYSSTVWVPPGWAAARDPAGNTILHRTAR